MLQPRGLAKNAWQKTGFDLETPETIRLGPWWRGAIVALATAWFAAGSSYEPDCERKDSATAIAQIIARTEDAENGTDRENLRKILSFEDQYDKNMTHFLIMRKFSSAFAANGEAVIGLINPFEFIEDSEMTTQYRIQSIRLVD